MEQITVQMSGEASLVHQEDHEILNTDKVLENTGSDSSSSTRLSIKQRNYKLNDVSALKKKAKQENREADIEIGNEAKNLSNVTIPMRASFFEFVKAFFVKDLLNDVNILKIDNIERAKAKTDLHGDAYVEFSLEITFKASLMNHTIKLTAYTTTSQIMIQPLYEKAGAHSHLGNRGSPRYFAENFLLPWSKRMIDENKFNEDTRNMYTNALKEEIRRLDLNKVEQKKAKTGNTIESTAERNDNGVKTKAKCVATGCSYQGINPGNKAAVGVCHKCGNFEHFSCVGITQEHKEAITQGKMHYFCSLCFSKDPSVGSIGSTQILSIKRGRLDSLPIISQGSLLKPPVTEQSRALTLNEISPCHKCDNCEFESSSIDELAIHVSKHKPHCSTCDRDFKSKEDLQTHIENDHSLLCDKC